MFAFIGIGVTLVMVMLAWTAIKTGHREFISQGQAAQVVHTSVSESLASLLSRTGELNLDDIGAAARALVDRVSYVRFFAMVIDRIPSTVPYERGAIWADAAIRPFTPRMFFPEKSIIDDSARTALYTGRFVPGIEEGTTVSLGYVAESYIDFGPLFMMLPLAGLGWIIGRFYRWIVNYKYSRGALGVGLASAALIQAMFLETSITKMLGGLVVTMLAATLIARWFKPLTSPRP